jgi:hypothetical protein
MSRFTVQIGLREIVVDTTPLATRPANFRTHTLIRSGDRRLLLVPGLVLRVLALSVLLIAGVSLTLAVWDRMSQADPALFWICCAIGLVFLLLGLSLLVLPRRYCFDLETEQMTIRSWKILARRPLIDVLAVQVIDGGWHRSTSSHGVKTAYRSYQLNLVLDDPNDPRLNLSDHSDWDSTWEAGRQLAEFLGVPFLEQVCEEEEEDGTQS